jgi:hypothetical protein
VLVTGKWSNLTLTGNTFVGINGMVITAALRNGSSWDHNAYFGHAHDNQANTLFGYNGKGFAFPQWQSQSGADRNSTYSEVMPRNAVFVRPNRYEQGRGNIAVYNWEHAHTVEVDISSVVSAGSQYEIRNAQDFFGAPVASGTYSGGTVPLPMTNLRVEGPTGLGFAVPSTLPDFNAFVVLPAGKYPVQDQSSHPALEQSQSAQAPVTPVPPLPAVPDTVRSKSAGSSVLERYVGTYISTNPKVWVVVSLEGDHLVAKMPNDRGQSSYRLSPSAGERFNLAGELPNVYLEFESHDNLSSAVSVHRLPFPTVRLTRVP